MSHRSKTRADTTRKRRELPRTYDEYAEARRRANNPLRLTEDMVRVLNKMVDGWTLRTSTTMSNSHTWLTSPKGDGHTDVKRTTADALHTRKLLDYAYSFPTASYSLNAYGKRVAADHGVAPRASR